MSTNDTMLPSIRDMWPGDHYCGIYRTDEDHRALIYDFIKQAVERNEKILYIVNIHSAAQLRATLAAGVIDVDRIIARGQLVILTAKDAYLKGGEFDPASMVVLLHDETQKALREGYSALAITGEMTWALAGEPGSERLVEYESQLNTLFPGSHSYAMCQYDRRRFDSEMLLEVLHTHPKVLCGTDGYDNSQMYFVPPEHYLSPDRQGGILDCRLRNLSARKQNKG